MKNFRLPKFDKCKWLKKYSYIPYPYDCERVYYKKDVGDINDMIHMASKERCKSCQYYEEAIWYLYSIYYYSLPCISAY